MSGVARILIADASAANRRTLRRLIQPESDFEWVGDAKTSGQAARMLKKRSPDILILEADLPPRGAFAFLTQLAVPHRPAIILTSDFSSYAVEGFRAGAVDYLLSPFTLPRLREALQRARNQATARLARQGAHLKLPPIDHGPIALNVRGKSVLIPIKEIDYIVAANNHSRVYSRERTYEVTSGLAAMSARLPAAQFIRISRSILVNLASIATLQPKSHGDQWIELRTGVRLVLARTRRSEVLGRLAGKSRNRPRTG